MDIKISQYAGFCSGVARAYSVIKKISKKKKLSGFFILGSLVHNNRVSQEIGKMGIERISFDKKLIKKKKAKAIIITAHGMGPEIYIWAKKNKIKIIDATCPLVIRVQKLAKKFVAKGFEIIIIGDKNHQEVRGIFEWAGKRAKVVEKEKEILKVKINSSNIAVLAQTTQDIIFFKKASEIIKKKNPKAKILNTICPTTHNRQEEARKMAFENDVMIIIGSRDSANSKRLFGICKQVNPKSYFIEDSSEILIKFFAGAKKVGITAGASVPESLIMEVVSKIEKI